MFPRTLVRAPRRALAIACASLLLAGAARPQQVAEVPPVIVTAARLAQPLDEALPSTTVIPRERILEEQAGDLAELLSRQAGVQISRLGGQGSQTSLFLRGADSNQVLVLVDGMRLNSPLSGAASLGGLSTASIDRIEIVRGNLSSLYGSEAIGGVIQVFTRDGGKPGAQVLAEAGGGRTLSADADLAVGEGAAFRFNVSAGARQQKAVSAMNPAENPGANPGLDGNHERHGALRVAGGLDGVSLSAWAWGSHSETGWDDNFDASGNFLLFYPPDTATRTERSDVGVFGFSAAKETSRAKFSLEAGTSRDDSSNVSSIPLSYDTNSFRSRSSRLALSATTLGPGLRWTGGLEALYQDGTASVLQIVTAPVDLVSGSYPLTGFDRRVESAWAGAGKYDGTWEWQANLRHDRYSDVGSATTGLAGAGWHFLPDWKATLQWSDAFRAPSFNDLYYPGFSNPSLRPERARSAEAGIRWSRGTMSASLAVYRNRTSDLIQARGNIPVNVARGASDGFELSAERSDGALRWGANLSQVRARNLDTGAELLRRARWQAQAHANLRHGRWDAGLEVARTSARDDFNFNPFPAVPVSLAPYTLARLTAQYEVVRDVRLRLRAENLTNAHYELAYGYNTLPREIIAGVEARW